MGIQAINEIKCIQTDRLICVFMQENRQKKKHPIGQTDLDLVEKFVSNDFRKMLMPISFSRYSFLEH